jgi:hypothetical protein
VLSSDSTNTDRSLCALQVEHDFHVDQALSELTVNSAKEIKRQAQLEHKLIDHDKIAHRHGTYSSEE